MNRVFAGLKKSSIVSASRPISPVPTRTSLTRISWFVPSQSIEPSSSWYRRWWLFTMVCALITAFFTPWEVTFTDQPGLSPYNDAPAFIEYLLTTVFILDIFVNLNVAFINPEGKIEINRKKIATHYLKFMFWIDLLGVLPISEFLFIFIKDESRVHFTLIRLFRLTRVHRLWAFFRDFEMNIHLNLITITLIRNFIVLLVSNHWAACIIYYIAKENNFDGETWFGFYYERPDELTGEMGGIDVPGWEKYTLSLYFAAAMMTTVVFGDVKPRNIAEVIFTLVFMIYNIALKAYITGTITLVVIKGDEATSRQRRGYEKLEKFARKHRLTPQIQKDLRDYLRFHYTHPQHHDTDLLQNLPSNVRRKVLYELYGNRLQNAPIFESCSTKFIASLFEPFRNSRESTVDVELYMPEDEIVSENKNFSSLNVILSGKAGMELCELGELEAFPVEPFLDLINANVDSEFQYAPYTVVANDICRVLCIPRETLLRSLNAYPEDKQVFVQNAVNISQTRFSADISQYPSNPLERPFSAPGLSKHSSVHFEDQLGFKSMDNERCRFVREIDTDSGLPEEKEALVPSPFDDTEPEDKHDQSHSSEKKHR